MQYLTYEEYKEIGGALDSAAFNRNIMRACKVIDSETHNRLVDKTDIPVEVKHCVRDLIEYYANNVSNGKTVTSKSQSAGGVSESESYSTKTAEDVSNEVGSIISDYLLSVKDCNGTSLLYRGRSC